MTNITTTPIQCSVQEPTRAQKRFNTLTKGLQRDKALLQQWMEAHTQLNVESTKKMMPLLQEIEAMKLKMLTILDACYNNKALTVKQKEKLHTFIQYVADTCLCFDASGFAEEIYDRYHDVSVAEKNETEEASLKSDLEELFGVNLGDDFDFSSESAYADFLGSVKEKQEQASSKQKKTKKRQAQPKVKEKSDNEVIESQSIKEVFRQLTKVLHPDREMDEAKKAHKNELMQRANVAYKKQDLLSLLELQFEVEQFEQKEFDALADEKLLAYNRMLQRQRKQIKEEIILLKQRISHELKIPPFYDTPNEAFFYLNQSISTMRSEKEQINEELEIFSDIKSLKRWLNAMKKSEIPTQDDNIFDEVMGSLFDFV